MELEDYTTPLLAEKYLSDEELFELFIKGMGYRDVIFNTLEQLERIPVTLQSRQLSQHAVTMLLNNEKTLKRLLHKFKQSHLITTGLIEIYWKKIDDTKEKAREITKRKNLGGLQYVI